MELNPKLEQDNFWETIKKQNKELFKDEYETKAINFKE